MPKNDQEFTTMQVHKEVSKLVKELKEPYRKHAETEKSMKITGNINNSDMLYAGLLALKRELGIK